MPLLQENTPWIAQTCWHSGGVDTSHVQRHQKVAQQLVEEALVDHVCCEWTDADVWEERVPRGVNLLIGTQKTHLVSQNT